MPIINPNSDKNYIDNLDIEDERNFPKFLKGIKLAPFRHITNLEIEFTHPISVITGNNRIGKSTILMAIACSHFNFSKRNPSNGNLERITWGSIMRFTQYDKQNFDWTYWIKYKLGSKIENKRGQRKALTNKWNGVAKKESQIQNRQVVFIDLDRIVPIRNSTLNIYNIARNSISTDISATNKLKVFEYLSYILEEDFQVNRIIQFNDKDVFHFINSNEYSSFNSASGEDVLTRILIDIIEAERNSLILIDEIEVGLHPKIQRRLVEILYYIARYENKQFVITSHSPTIINTFNDRSRLFIERHANGNIKTIPQISMNAALTKMDTYSYPLVNLYCEDELSFKIIRSAIIEIQNTQNILNFGELINIIISGSVSDTYTNFIADKRTYIHKKIRTGYACVLDGDMRNKRDSYRNLLYPTEELLFFLFDTDAPEKFLLKKYLSIYPNATLLYHLNSTNVHALFNKMVECSIAVDKDNAFDICWRTFLGTSDGIAQFGLLKTFLIKICTRFSPDL